MEPSEVPYTMANSDNSTSPETRRGRRKSRIFLKPMLRLHRLYSKARIGPATPELDSKLSCYNGIAGGGDTAPVMPRAGKIREASLLSNPGIITVF
jgi:hypothetical protein